MILSPAFNIPCLSAGPPFITLTIDVCSPSSSRTAPIPVSDNDKEIRKFSIDLGDK